MRLFAALVIALAVTPIALGAAGVTGLNYIYVKQGNTAYQYQLMGSSIMLPQKCSGNYDDWLIYLDPRSSIGISNIQVIYVNGSTAQYMGMYTPKYASLHLGCGSIYGLYITLSRYPPPPPYGYIQAGLNHTIKLTPGINNITIPVSPGFSLMYAYIRVTMIGPGSLIIKSPFTHIINSTQASTEVGGFQLPVTQDTIITFMPQSIMYLNVSGVAYASIYPTYYTTVFNTGLAYIIGEPYYDAKYSGELVNAPRLYPSQVYIKNASISSINPNPAVIYVYPPCSNLIASGGQYVNGHLVTQVPRNVTLFLSGNPLMNLSIDSIPLNNATLSLGVLSNGIEVMSLDGEPLNGTVVLSNGRSTIRPGPGVCISPGVYSAIVVAGNYSFQLSANVTLLNPSIIVPMYSRVAINVTSNVTSCLGTPYLLVNGVKHDYGAPLDLHYVKNGSSIQIELAINGVTLAQRAITINGTNISISIPINMARLRVTDLLGSPLSDYTVNVGGLTYVDTPNICIPSSVSFIVIQVGNQEYVAKASPQIHVTAWALTHRSIYIILAIMSFIAFIAIALKIRGRRSRDGNDEIDYI